MWKSVVLIRIKFQLKKFDVLRWINPYLQMGNHLRVYIIKFRYY